jgi:hypothetical protein
MNDELKFLAALAEALAHSVVYFAKEECPHGWGVLHGNLGGIGLAKAFGANASTPPDRNALQEGIANEQAQLQLMPQRYAADAEYMPKYLGLDMDLLKTAVPGLVDTLQQNQPGLSALSSSSNTAQRTADIADVTNLGPAATAAFRAANPQQTTLTDALNKSAMEGLTAGGGLTPSESLAVSEGAGAAGASRGLGFGPTDVYRDTLAQDASRNTRLQQRQQFGTQIAGLNKETSLDPFMSVLGRPSGTPAMDASLLGAGSGIIGGAGPKLTDPFSAYGADLANTNYNASAAARIANANSQNALLGSALSY